jgi:AcrR family transcriptional regulator
MDTNETNNLISHQARAEQILDAAADLIARFGYKRVTMDDIATQADIGRGTIYQYWKTREALYSAVIEREFLAVIDEVLLAIRHDPIESLPHRVVRTEFLTIMRRPILHAIFTADISMLGKLSKGGIDKALEVHQNMIFNDYQQLLVEHGLLRDDISYAELDHALTATVIGFFLAEPFSGDDNQLSLERQGDLLATTVRRAFEIEATPDVIQAVAPRVIELLTEISNDLQADLRQAYE